MACSSLVARSRISAAAGKTDSITPICCIVVGSVALLALHPLERVLFNRKTVFWFRRHDGPLMRGFLAALCFLLVLIPALSDQPFIYFRF